MKSILILAALVLTGCSTATSNPSFYHEPVTVRVPHIGVEKPQGKVTVMRDDLIVGMAMSTYLLIDGVEVGAVDNGDKASFSLPPGEHFIGLRSLGVDARLAMISLGLAKPVRVVEHLVNIEDDKEYFYRISLNASDEWEINRTSR